MSINKFKRGDYVKVKEKSYESDEYKKFSNQIGKIVYIGKDTMDMKPYTYYYIIFIGSDLGKVMFGETELQKISKHEVILEVL